MESATGLLVPAQIPAVAVHVPSLDVGVGAPMLSPANVAPMASSAGSATVSAQDFVLDTGAATWRFDPPRPMTVLRASRTPHLQPPTSAQCVTAPVVTFIDSACTAAAEALLQVA